MTDTQEEMDEDWEGLNGEEQLGIYTSDRSGMHEFLPALSDMLGGGTSEEGWEGFQQIIREVTDKVGTVVKIPVCNSNTNDNARPKPSPEDPKWMRKLYKGNGRGAIGIILGEDSRGCDIDRGAVDRRFNKTAACRPCDVRIYDSIQTPEDRNSVPTSRITPGEVAERLSECENTAPGGGGGALHTSTGKRSTPHSQYWSQHATFAWNTRIHRIRGGHLPLY
jgi:hypothetical protein